MVLIERELFDKNQTGREMYRIIRDYSDDLYGIEIVDNGNVTAFPFLCLHDAFRVIADIPYIEDKEPIEILSRPKYINSLPGADCKKKSILMASWCRLNGIPYRLVAMSNLPDKHFHHVFTQCKLNGSWLNLDPTYNNGIPFENKVVTNYEVLRK